MHEKNQIENIGMKHYSYLKINISFISLYILSMSRKKNTILTFSNIPVHKGGNQVPFFTAIQSRRALQGCLFKSSAGRLCLP